MHYRSKDPVLGRGWLHHEKNVFVAFYRWNPRAFLLNILQMQYVHRLMASNPHTHPQKISQDYSRGPFIVYRGFKPLNGINTSTCECFTFSPIHFTQKRFPPSRLQKTGVFTPRKINVWSSYTLPKFNIVFGKLLSFWVSVTCQGLLLLNFSWG